MIVSATLSKTATGSEKSKILDAHFGTAELVFQVNMTPSEFGKFIETYNEKEFEIEIKETV